ncbi:OLC1v1011103C1 [Oldenlandia corymbosa var. corymbosa]|uniref:OLC1v1011103C1 n=1 Tax=Oldenlandia corymbosa var. corymbosa TaxID=529605 RepID=A0AAV1DST0_OLDCO|nr:OLC1v1011103C1 [Oldenlandia corymbosa var. corymbosa]
MAISSNLCEPDYTFLIFKCVDFPSVFCVNTVIKAYACSYAPEKAVFFYFEMLKNGFLPNSFSFPPLLSVCAKMRSLNLGHKCHGQVVKNGVDGILEVQNSLLHLYASCGLLTSVRQILVDMPVKDSVSWNTIMDGFIRADELDMAQKLFDAMPQRNVISWNIMMTAFLDLGKPGNGLKLFREMVKSGFKPNETSMVNVLSACGRSARLKEGKSVHRALIKDFENHSVIVGTSLIDMYSKCGRLDAAQFVFERMPVKNLVSWNAMILGHCIHGNPQDGLNLYREMLSRSSSSSKQFKSSDQNRIVPDEITFIGVLLACAREGRLTEGRSYFTQMVEAFGLKPNFAHYWCMANILDRADHREEAIELLRNLPFSEDASPEILFLARLFGSCRFEGNVVLGEQLAKHLIEQDPQNFSCFALLVNLYAVAGKWEEVSVTKEMMKEKGIKRNPGCGLKDMNEIVHQMVVPELRDRRIVGL